MSYSVPDPHYEELLPPDVKPVGKVVIDWGHPLTRGLAGCWLFQSDGISNLVTCKRPENIFGTPVISPDDEHWFAARDS